MAVFWDEESKCRFYKKDKTTEAPQQPIKILEDESWRTALVFCMCLTIIISAIIIIGIGILIL